MAFVKAYFGDFSGIPLNPPCGKFVFVAFQKDEDKFNVRTDCGLVAYWQYGAGSSPYAEIATKAITKKHDIFQYPFMGQSIITKDWTSPGKTSFYDLHHCADVEDALTEFNLLRMAYDNLSEDRILLNAVERKTRDRNRGFIGEVCKMLMDMRKTFNGAMIWEGEKHRYLCKIGDVRYFVNEKTSEENKREGIRIDNNCNVVEYVIPQKDSDYGRVKWRMPFATDARFLKVKDEETDDDSSPDGGRKMAVFGDGCEMNSVIIGKEYEILSRKTSNGQVYFRIRNEDDDEVFVNSRWVVV